jgi:hypothetical protein
VVVRAGRGTRLRLVLAVGHRKGRQHSAVSRVVLPAHSPINDVPQVPARRALRDTVSSVVVGPANQHRAAHQRASGGAVHGQHLGGGHIAHAVASRRGHRRSGAGPIRRLVAHVAASVRHTLPEPG